MKAHKLPQPRTQHITTLRLWWQGTALQKHGKSTSLCSWATSAPGCSSPARDYQHLSCLFGNICRITVLLRGCQPTSPSCRRQVFSCLIPSSRHIIFWRMGILLDAERSNPGVFNSTEIQMQYTESSAININIFFF